MRNAKGREGVAVDNVAALRLAAEVDRDVAPHRAGLFDAAADELVRLRAEVAEMLGDMSDEDWINRYAPEG